MKKRSKTLIAFLLMISLVFTTGTFAYWASNVEGTSSKATESLIIGSAEGVDTEFVLSNENNSGGFLVPANQLENSLLGSVDTVYLSYDLQWIEAEDISQLEGTITTSDIEVSHSISIYQNNERVNASLNKEVYNLVNVSYHADNPSTLTLDDPSETFRFEVTLEEPSNKEEYNIIHDSEIIITFHFDIYDSNVETKDIEEESEQVNLIEEYKSEIVLDGDEILYVEVGQDYEEPGYEAYDSKGNPVYIKWYSGDLNTWEIGTYELTYYAYSLVDYSRLEPKTRTIIVEDTTAPVITLNGDETFYVEQNSYYNDWGAWAVDNSGEEVTVEVIEDNVDFTTQGTYFVTYYSVDSSGNEAYVTRIVIVN